jgi:hypothetical protein
MDLTIHHGFLQRLPLNNRWFQAACVAVVIFVIYYVTGRSATPYNQYVLLADAFLDGHLYLVNPPDWLELSRVGEKAFVINPPAPTLFLLPWVAIWGTSVNQVVVSMILGSAAIGLFWVAAAHMGWSFRFRLGITALVALGTNFWWASTDGSVWAMAQVSAVFFLMAALAEATGGRRPWLMGLLVGLAGLSRLPTFLTFPFFAYMAVRGEPDRQIAARKLLIFGLALAAMGAGYIAYTYGEYGTFTLGYRGQFTDEPWFSKGLFDISYVPRQLNAILFQGPVFVDKFPFFKPSFMGLGLFLTTPALLYAFRSRLGTLERAALAALVLTAIPIVTYGATGWAQFGYRFSLDVLPFVVILVASGMRHDLDRLKIAVIVLSCAINLWGTLAFHKLDWVA